MTRGSSAAAVNESRHELRLHAPFLSVFGSTETGLCPASKGRFPIGEVPQFLAKEVCTLCDYQLVDENNIDVPEGKTGEHGGYALRTASISARLCAVSFQRTAAAFTAICSGRDAPEMMLEIDGCTASQDMARVSNSCP